jgi:hypothetical protein
VPSADTCFTPVTLSRRWHCRPSLVRHYLRSGLLSGFELPGSRGLRIAADEVERFERARAVVKPKRKRSEKRPSWWTDFY